MKTFTFSRRRFGWLFRRYFAEKYRKELTYWGTMLLAMMLFRHWIVGLWGLFFVGGAVFASAFFREIHQPANGAAYFMIPASRLEKLLSAIVLTTVYYFGMMTFCYVAGNWLGTTLNNWLARLPVVSSGYLALNERFYVTPLQWALFEVRPFLPFGGTLGGQSQLTPGIWLFAKNFPLTQSLFLLGGIYFRKHPLMKTTFVILFVPTALLLLLILEIRLVMGPTLTENIAPWLLNRARALVFNGMYFVLPFFFWTVSAVRLKEWEIDEKL
jgi:hypothetical protein